MKHEKSFFVGIGWVGVVLTETLVLVCAFVFTTPADAAPVLPVFNMDDFINPTNIDNPWFSLPLGTKLEYEGETADGTETVVIEITGDTKTVMGVTTLVYRDRVYLDGELIEDTRDYVAQDNDGNVWYFGEDVDNYEGGKLDNHDGAWLAGKDGARPGYWMPADPDVGDEYKQEFLDGEAEDEAQVVSLSARVVTDLDTYANCLKTKDTTPLEPGVVEYKYYCTQVKGLVLEENPADDERLELIRVTRGDRDDALRGLQLQLIDLLRHYIALFKN